MLDIASPAPDFTLPQGHGSDVTLSALQGAPIVLYFYPRDDTPGCTTQSIAFSENLDAFVAAGAKVFGISKDSVASHANFAAKRDLTVPLLSDENGSVCQDYGVWKEKNMYGRTFMGIERTTYLIDAKGDVAMVWPKVKVAGHAEAVLAAVQAL